MRRSVYSHNGEAYIIIDQKLIHHFCKTFEDEPNMKYVQMYMEWCKADHVLRNQSHFLFCETITDAEVLEDNLYDV